MLSHLVPNNERMVLPYAMNGRRVSTLITDCVSIREITFRILMIEVSEMLSWLVLENFETLRICGYNFCEQLHVSTATLAMRLLTFEGEHSVKNVR